MAKESERAQPRAAASPGIDPRSQEKPVEGKAATGPEGREPFICFTAARAGQHAGNAHFPVAGPIWDARMAQPPDVFKIRPG